MDLPAVRDRALPWFARAHARTRLERLALAVLLPAALVAATRLSAGAHGGQFLFVPVLGVALVALLAGVRAGLLASGISVAAAAWSLVDVAGGAFGLLRLAGMGVVTILVAWATGSLRAAYRRAAEERAAALALAEQLAHEKERAERAVTARDDVLAIVSHDLKNPLATIVIGAGLIERRCESREPDLCRHARTIRENALAANRLIGDLLDAAALEAGQLSIERRPAAVHAIAEEAVERFRPLADAAGLALELHAADEPLEVACDRDRILQVLSNLIGNSVKVTPPGGHVRISVEAAPGEVRVSVADDGPGIDPRDLPHLFERFRRGRAARYPGSGLGLAIARGIVEAHGGAMRVESVPGQGARFSFGLPRGERAGAAGGAAPGQSGETSFRAASP